MGRQHIYVRQGDEGLWGAFVAYAESKPEHLGGRTVSEQVVALVAEWMAVNAVAHPARYAARRGRPVGSGKKEAKEAVDEETAAVEVSDDEPVDAAAVPVDDTGAAPAEEAVDALAVASDEFADGYAYSEVEAVPEGEEWDGDAGEAEADNAAWAGEEDDWEATV